MITQQQLKSYQRLLRTYINRSRAEINNLTARTPLNTAEAAQKQHLLTLHAQLLNNAEALLAFVDLMLGVESNGRNRHDEMLAATLDLFHLANAMYDQNGSFLYRTSNGRTVGGGYEGGDYEWAENRISAYDLISILNGNTIPSPTPEQVVENMTFASAPAQQGPTNTTAQVQQARSRFAERFSANHGFREFMENVLGLDKGALAKTLGRRDQSPTASLTPDRSEKFDAVRAGAARLIEAMRGSPSKPAPLGKQGVPFEDVQLLGRAAGLDITRDNTFLIDAEAFAAAAERIEDRHPEASDDVIVESALHEVAPGLDEALEQGKAAAFYWRGM